MQGFRHRKSGIFYGHLKDFGKILGESDIFVLPSFYEGFPNALIEAMSVPLACISSNCVAGPSDIIQHERNGMLYEPGNIEELTTLLNILTGNTDLRQSLSNEAIKIRETLEFKKIAQQYLDFILGK
ncbi:MAG: glycosyltransferase [Saprospiraceae bacterium]|nr:glycosyltransferase [Saprospiraceae bacterium]